MFYQHNEIINSLILFLREYAIWCVLFGLLLENVLFIGFIIPGLTILIVAGFLAFFDQSNPLSLVLAGTIGTFIGDNINFSIGRFSLTRWSRVKEIVKDRSVVKNFMQSVPEPIYIFYHFPGYLRTFFPMLLGAMRFPVYKWIALELTAAPLFNIFYVYLGWYGAKVSGELTSIIEIGNNIALYLFFATIAGLIFAVFKLTNIKHYISRKRLGKTDRIKSL